MPEIEELLKISSQILKLEQINAVQNASVYEELILDLASKEEQILEKIEKDNHLMWQAFSYMNAKYGYDLKDTPEDQAYGGASAEKSNTNDAVSETEGIVLVCQGKIVPAYYSASAGGKTRTGGQVWSADLPFLKSVPSFDDGIKKNGHGVGMSQYGANNLAKRGYNAYQILKYFYANTKFARVRSQY